MGKTNLQLESECIEEQVFSLLVETKRWDDGFSFLHCLNFDTFNVEYRLLLIEFPYIKQLEMHVVHSWKSANAIVPNEQMFRLICNLKEGHRLIQQFIPI